MNLYLLFTFSHKPGRETKNMSMCLSLWFNNAAGEGGSRSLANKSVGHEAQERRCWPLKGGSNQLPCFRGSETPLPRPAGSVTALSSPFWPTAGRPCQIWNIASWNRSFKCANNIRNLASPFPSNPRQRCQTWSNQFVQSVDKSCCLKWNLFASMALCSI